MLSSEHSHRPSGIITAERGTGWLYELRQKNLPAKSPRGRPAVVGELKRQTAKARHQEKGERAV